MTVCFRVEHVISTKPTSGRRFFFARPRQFIFTPQCCLNTKWSTKPVKKIEKKTTGFTLSSLQNWYDTSPAKSLQRGLENPQIPFLTLQSLVSSLLLAYTISNCPSQSGLLLLGLTLGVSLSGYVHCIQQSLQESQGSLQEVWISAHGLATRLYSPWVNFNRKKFSFEKLCMSVFYEPSPVYLLLNSWGIYSVSHCTLSHRMNGLFVLGLASTAFLLGRFLQYLILARQTPVETTQQSGEVSRKWKMIEAVLMPSGTWGMGPVLNSLIWFCCFSFPKLLYLATPTGVMAPIWTALWVPVLLLVEDVFSLLQPERRIEKIQSGITPGLQVAALIVGYIASLLCK